MVCFSYPVNYLDFRARFWDCSKVAGYNSLARRVLMRSKMGKSNVYKTTAHTKKTPYREKFSYDPSKIHIQYKLSVIKPIGENNTESIVVYNINRKVMKTLSLSPCSNIKIALKKKL